MTSFLGDIETIVILNCFYTKKKSLRFITASFFSFFRFTLLIKGHRGQPYTNDIKVKNFIHWIKTRTDSEEVRTTVIGGYYPYPPVPETFLKYSSSVKGTNIIASHVYVVCYMYDCHNA